MNDNEYRRMMMRRERRAEELRELKRERLCVAIEASAACALLVALTLAIIALVKSVNAEHAAEREMKRAHAERVMMEGGRA